MPLTRTGFHLQYEELCPGNPVLGTVAVIPWDSDIFGFKVASYRLPPDAPPDDIHNMLGASLSGWATANAVVLCSCAVPATDRYWRGCLPQAGFHLVNFSLQVSLNGLQIAKLPAARAELREATPADHESIKRIAAAGFQHGRYHADPRFPRELADRRYSQWMTNALSGDDPQDRVFVLGEIGRVQGFYHVTIERDVSDLRLASVAPEFKGTMLGFDLYASILHVLKQRGVRRVVASISAANTAVMNVFAALGFRFSQPEMIYHWHAEAPLQ